MPRREFRCAAAQALRDDGRKRSIQEHNRLLYVALTRAEDRLVVCGWQTRREPDESCWYNLVSRAFGTLPAERSDFAAWPGDTLSLETKQTAEPEPRGQAESAAPREPLPAWIGRAPDWRAAPPPPEPASAVALVPSRPEGVELGEVPGAASPLGERDMLGDRFRRGQIIHTLLQHLPALPPSDQAEAARRWLDRPGAGVPAEMMDALIAEVLAILRHPDLAPLFGADGRAEVPLTGVIGDSVVGGLVDRLAVLADRVLLADFKTNRRPPVRVADTPVLYLRQMASYRAVLRAIFPDLPVHCALVWTRSAEVAMLPESLLDDHDPATRAPISHAASAP
jgi:ATP-dependent helicase/nuclease subunit A